MEFKVGLIQNPLPANDPNSDFESLKFNFVFSHKAFSDSRQTIKAIANVKRKSSNLDMKGLLLYESINSDFNLECNVNYGKNKQVSVTIFWSHPRTTLEEIKAHINITVPTFTPMAVKVEISELHNRDYKVSYKNNQEHAIKISNNHKYLINNYQFLFDFRLILAEQHLVVTVLMQLVFTKILVPR